MPESTDAQGTTPASASTATGTTATAPVTPAVDLNKVLEDNRNLREQRDRLAGQFGEYRRQVTPKLNRAAELEKQIAARGADTTDLDFGETTTARPSSADADRLSSIESKQAEIDFKLSNPDWNKVIDDKTGKTLWDEMNTILFDDSQMADLAGRTPYATLQNIRREVKNRLYEAREKAAAAASPGADRNQLRARAALSGQSAGEGQEIVNVDDLTHEQMIEQGLVEFDPHNPPEHARKLFSKL